MSWLYRQIHYMVCKVTPTGTVCQNFLKDEHPECFKEDRNYLFFLQLPKRFWLYVTSGGAAHDCRHSPVPGRCCMMSHGHDYELIYGMAKIICILAIFVGILYSILKLTTQRRPTLQQQ